MFGDPPCAPTFKLPEQFQVVKCLKFKLLKSIHPMFDPTPTCLKGLQPENAQEESASGSHQEYCLGRWHYVLFFGHGSSDQSEKRGIRDHKKLRTTPIGRVLGPKIPENRVVPSERKVCESILLQFTQLCAGARAHTERSYHRKTSGAEAEKPVVLPPIPAGAPERC